MEGTQVGPYRILDKLGSGGMGEVWLAEDTRLDRMVALKFLPHFAAQDENEKARFVQEAKAAAKLSHAHIAQVYEIGEEDGRLYIVMEYVAGGSLRDRLDEAGGKPLPLEKVMHWVEQTAEGLAEANRQGITHRDIKPDNLMLTDTGQVKITDFGLARLETATRLTASGTTLGTVNYMSPELIQGRDVDHRSDLFSLGATVYELLSGQQVFSGQDANAIYYAILNAPVPPLARYRKDLPEGLDGIIDKLLERDPGRRYQAAAEVATDIRRLITPLTTTSVFTVWQRTIQRRMQLIPRSVYAVVCLLLGLLAGVTLLVSQSGPVDLSGFTYTFFEGTSEPTSRGVYSHGGNQVAFQKRLSNRDWQIWIRDLDLNETRPICIVPHGFPADDLFWSVDDEYLYFNWAHIQLNRVRCVGADDSETVLAPVQAATLSPDNELVYLNRHGLMIAPHPDSSVATHRPYEPFPQTIKQPTQLHYPYHLWFSPDGKNLGLAAFHSETALDSLYSLHQGRGLTENIPTSCGFWIFPWPDSRNKEPYEPFDLSALTRDEPPMFGWMDEKNVVLSQQTNRPEGGLWFGNIRTGKLKRITCSSQLEGFPSLSPDGRILHDREFLDYDIVAVPLDGSQPWAILATTMREYSPSLSRDGAMAYITDRTEFAEIRLRYPDGDDKRIVGQPQFPDEHQPFLILTPAVISPDGKWIAFQGMRRGSFALRNTWIASTEGGQPRLLLEDDNYLLRGVQCWSPQSDRLVGNLYTAKDEEPVGLAIVDRSGNPSTLRTVIPDDVAFACQWSPDGLWIAASCRRSIRIFTPTGRFLEPIRFYHDFENFGFVWSRDSSHVFIYANAPFYPQYFGVWEIDVASNSIHRGRISSVLFQIQGTSSWQRAVPISPISGGWKDSNLRGEAGQ